MSPTFCPRHQRSLALAFLLLLFGLSNLCRAQLDPERPMLATYQVNVIIDQSEADKVELQITRLRTALEAFPGIPLAVTAGMQDDFDGDDAVVEIVAAEDFEYVELMKLVDLTREAGFPFIRIKAFEGLQWEAFDRRRYDKIRFKKPTVLTVLADLCPACRRMRDRHWNSKTILKQLAARDAALFFAVVSQDGKIKEFVKSEFGREPPLLIISNAKMGDTPKILPKIPFEKDILKALEEKLPLEEFARKTEP